jgi:hypothetical protein
MDVNAVAPLLSVIRTTTNTILVSWPSASTGWSPQQNSSLDSTNWVTPPETVSDNGTNRFILIAPSAGSTCLTADFRDKYPRSKAPRN